MACFKQKKCDMNVTSPSELVNFLAGTGSHEFGHDSGLVWQKFYFGLSGDLDDSGHYLFTSFPTPTDPGVLLMMNKGELTFTEFHLGKHGEKVWSEYDQIHLQHQYANP